MIPNISNGLGYKITDIIDVSAIHDGIWNNIKQVTVTDLQRDREKNQARLCLAIIRSFAVQLRGSHSFRYFVWAYLQFTAS